MIVRVYTCQNATLLEISCHGPYIQMICYSAELYLKEKWPGPPGFNYWISFYPNLVVCTISPYLCFNFFLNRIVCKLGDDTPIR